MKRLIQLALASALAAATIAAAPAPTPTPKKPAAATPAKKAPTVKIAPVAPVASPTPDAPAVMDGERKIASGEAHWKLGKTKVDGKEAAGTIQTSGEFKIAALEFPAGKKEKLKIEFMYTGPGPVDQGYMTKVYAVDNDGRYHAWKKGVGDCSVNLIKASALELEGTLSCPKGLLDEKDMPAKPITEARFKVKADSASSKPETWTP